MDAFIALADPTRRDILDMLAARGRMSASDIGSRFSSSAPAISQHLKVLRETNLVQVEKKAQQRIYSLNPIGIFEVGDWVDHMRAFWDARLDSLDAFLKTESPTKE